MRRRRLPPDTRPDWRDPQMPVIRDYLLGNGTRKRIVDPEYESQWRSICMEINTHPTWRNDPTYNMRRKPK